MALTRQMMYRNATLPHPIGAHEVDSLRFFMPAKPAAKKALAPFWKSEKRILMTMPLPTCHLSTLGGKHACLIAETSNAWYFIASCPWLGMQIGCISQNYWYNGASIYETS